MAKIDTLYDLHIIQLAEKDYIVRVIKKTQTTRKVVFEPQEHFKTPTLAYAVAREWVGENTESAAY